MTGKRNKPKTPEMIELDTQQLEALVNRLESNSLSEEDRVLMRQILESYAHFFSLVDDKKTTIARLRKLLFGSQSEKTKDVVGDSSAGTGSSEEDGSPQEGESPKEDGAAAADDSSPEDSPPEDGQSASRSGQDGLADESPSRAPGHGRNGVDQYPGADRVEVPHETLSAGDACPDCDGGKLYEKTPSVLVRIVGQAPLKATIYALQRLRCHLCGKVFTAPAPAEAGSQKYDATAASMIGLLKYGSGFPFNRLQRLQENVWIPLPASTQWDVVHAYSYLLASAHEEFLRQAARGEVIHNDDTTVKILELMGERAQQNEIVLEDQREISPDRTGLFTSGVVATRDGNRMALFFSGRQHAGENLADVLKLRATELAAPIQMCDALSRNLPKELETIVANCLAHGRRRFVDIYDRFSDECRFVLESLKVVYHNDAVAREQELSPEQRLAYHQTHSQPTMNELHAWMQRQFDEKIVEPNSALGDAIRYMQKHWDKLTLFLRKAGAPLDNNVCERALKKAILHRKNSLFYKTQNGARVGDMYMSLIYTCELNGANAFDYLHQLQLHALDVAQHPELWMPWNYRENLEASRSAA